MPHRLKQTLAGLALALAALLPLGAAAQTVDEIISRGKLVVAVDTAYFQMREIQAGNHAGGALLFTVGRARSLELSAALSAALDTAGVDHSIQRAGNLFSVAFGTSARGVHNYDDAQGQEVFRYAPFFHSMLDSGVYLPPSVFEAWFLSAAHDDAAMNRIFDALPAAAKAAAAAQR